MPIEINNTDHFIEKKVPNLCLRSEPMQEIISRKPSFAARWALFFFAGILLILLAATWFIKYPQTVITTATLTGTNAPKEIMSYQDGRLIKLFIKNDVVLQEGDIIGWIESTGKHQEIISLSKKLDSALSLINKDRSEPVNNLFSKQFGSLGELQTPYQQFITAYQQFNDYLVNGFYTKKKAALQTDISWLQKANSNFQEQKKLLLHDLQLTEDEYKANESLHNDHVISKQDLRNEESKWIGKQLTIPQLDASLLSNETQQRDKQKDIIELEHSISQQKIIFQQALQTLQSQVNDWKRKYLLLAPASGKLVLIVPLQENQFLKTGKLLGFINPINSTYYAEIILPQNNFGKVDTGQQTQLRFDAYPYTEFGFVKGKLEYISNIATDSGFIAHVQLPNGLMTNQHKPIQYKTGLKAQALIVTKDMRLLEQFFYNTVKAIKQ